MLRLRICTHVTPRGTVFVNFKARRDISSAQMACAQDSRAFTLQPPPEKRGLEGGATGVLEEIKPFLCRLLLPDCHLPKRLAIKRRRLVYYVVDKKPT
jgi:hypothetical protein